MILEVFSSLCNSMILCHVVGLSLRGMAYVKSYSNDQFKTEWIFLCLEIFFEES